MVCFNTSRIMLVMTNDQANEARMPTTLVKNLFQPRYVGFQRAETDAHEDARSNSAPHPANAVNAEHVQGVVNAQPVNQLNGGKTDCAGHPPDDQGRHCADKSRRRSDGHQAGHRAGRRPTARLSLGEYPRDDRPGPHSRRRGCVGDDEGIDGGLSGKIKAAARVESEPPEPQQARPQHNQRHVVGRHGYRSETRCADPL